MLPPGSRQTAHGGRHGGSTQRGTQLEAAVPHAEGHQAGPTAGQTLGSEGAGILTACLFSGRRGSSILKDLKIVNDKIGSLGLGN